MMKWLICAVVATTLLCVAPLSAQADEKAYVPAIKVVFEVRSPQGDLRSFQRAGEPPTYWAQELPVVQGDELTINPMITTGGAELAELLVRLDNDELSSKAEPPWRVKVNTADVEAGYHMVEVWAATKKPNAMENSATATFLVVPETDPLLRVLGGATAESGPPVTDEERLACTIRSRDPKADEQLTEAAAPTTVSKATLFFVSAGPAVREFFYTLTRDGRVTYVSPKLPIETHVLLEPRNEEGQGQEPGRLIFTMRAGDGAGRFGAPAWVTVDVKALEAAE